MLLLASLCIGQEISNEKISKDKSAWKTNEYMCVVVVVLFEFGREDYQQQQQETIYKERKRRGTRCFRSLELSTEMQ